MSNNHHKSAASVESEAKQMNNRSVPLIASLLIVSATIGLAGGYFISPTYQQTMYTKEDMGLGQADRFVDLRYIDKMAAHHTAAILLADQIDDQSQRQEIKDLAAEIQTNEPKLIAELYQWKKDWYNDGRKVKNPTVANLGTVVENNKRKTLRSHFEAWRNEGNSNSEQPAISPTPAPVDEKIDLRFLNALIAHHEAGIAMTQEIRTKSSRREILDNADAVETFLTTTLQTLKGWREEWFNVK